MSPTKIVVRYRDGEVETYHDPGYTDTDTFRSRLPRGASANFYVDGEPEPIHVERRTLWSEFQHRAPVWVAVIGAGLLWFVSPGYEGLIDYLGQGQSDFFLGLLGLGFIALVVYVTTRMRAERPRHAWLWALLGGVAAVLVLTAFRAIGDSYVLRHHNCWVVAGKSSSEEPWSVWECAPGDHEPFEYVETEEEYDGRSFVPVGGSSRTCDWVDELLIESGDLLYDTDAIEALQELPPSDSYWVCEESEF